MDRDKHYGAIQTEKPSGLQDKNTFSSTFGPIAENHNEMSNGSINERDLPPKWCPKNQETFSQDNRRKKASSTAGKSRKIEKIE